MLLAFCHGPASNTELIPKEYTWEQLAQRMAKPSVGPKNGSYLLRGGLMKEYTRENENLLEAELAIIDGDSSFDPETGEVHMATDPDDGKLKGNSTPIEVARDALDRLGYKYVIHTTHTNTPGILNKWRAFIPAKMKSPAELEAVVEHVIGQMHAQGCYVESNRESKTWAQAWYLPRVKPQYTDSYKCFASLVGTEVDVAAAVNVAMRQKAAVDAVAKAQEMPRPQTTPTGPSPIEQFNNAATMASVKAMLEKSGYKFAFRRGDSMRFIAPGSESGTPGVTVFKGSKRGDICAYSHHGGHDPLSGRLNDAFGMLTRLRHGGNQEQAMEEAKIYVGWKERQENLDDFDEEEVPDTIDNAVAAAKKKKAPLPQIKLLSFVDLMDDETPEEPDYIAPDFLGQGNFCLIAGPPKAQKSFLLTEMLVACATGQPFLADKFTVPRPLKVFYLQAEMNRKLLRRRAKMMSFLDDEQRQLLHRNLVVTERLTMQLTEEGSQAAIDAMKHAFPDGGPDIIAIDPLANLFDGDNEDKAAEIMRFLTQRLEVIRRAVNPLAGIILVHHSAKKNVEDMARDPFVAIRGSGALRGYYDTGIVIYRKGEDGPERQIHFELRNGESPEAMTVKLNTLGTFSVLDTSVKGISRATAQAILAEIDDRWSKGNPLAMAANTGGRCAPRHFARKLELPFTAVKQLLDDWIANEVVMESVSNAHSKLRGLKKLANL
jgi:hypothetical protein